MHLASIANGLLSSRLFAFGVLAFSIGYFFVFVFFGLDLTDSFFHLNATVRPTDNPLLLLTSLVGQAIHASLGDTLVGFRLVNRFTYILAVVVPYVSLVRHRTDPSNLLCAAAAMLALNILNPGHYGYTNVSILFLSLAETLLIRYLRTPRLGPLAAFGVACSAAGLTRFPNIVIAPVSLMLGAVAISVDRRSKSGLYQAATAYLVHVSVYLCALGIPLGLMATWAYGSPSEYWRRLADALLQTQHHGHAPRELLRRYLWDVTRIFEDIGFLVLLAYAGPSCARLPTLLRRSYRGLISGVFALLIYYAFRRDPYAYSFSLFLSAVMFLLLWNALIRTSREEAWPAVLALLSLPAVASVVAMGSDTGLLKLAPLLVVFAPWVVEQCDGARENPWFVGYMAVLVVLIIPLKAVSIYEDAPVTKLTQTVQAPALAGIRTTPARAAFVEDVLAAYDEEKRRNRTVMFFGKVAHAFDYLAHQAPLYPTSFRMRPDDEAEVRRAERVIASTRPVVFFVPEYPDAGDKRQRATAFEKMLERYNYQGEARGGYTVYRPLAGVQPQND